MKDPRLGWSPELLCQHLVRCRQIPNLDQTPPEAIGQACWDALPRAGCVPDSCLLRAHTSADFSLREPLLPGPHLLGGSGGRKDGCGLNRRAFCRPVLCFCISLVSRI